MKIPNIKHRIMVDAPEAEGCSMPLPSWATNKRFFTHRSIEPGDSGFVCAEATTGCVVGRGISREQAIARAIARLSEYTELEFKHQVQIRSKENESLKQD